MSTVCAARSVNSPTAARLKYDPKKRAPLPIAPLIVISGTMDALRNVPPGMNRQVPQLPVCNLISVEDNQQRTWPVIVENIRRFRLCFRPIHDIFRDLLQRPSNIAEVEAVAIQNGGELPSNVSRNAVTDRKSTR